jgi:tetratricopeptide (TPR) repeat protein
MILDNADDASVFFNSAKGRQPSKADGSLQETEYLSDFLPQSQNGSILITSRDRDTAFRLTGNYTDIIKVEPMDKHHALALLQKKLDSSPDEDDALKLLQNLDYIPLAITQAAAYIKQRAPRTTVSTYLNELSRSDRDRARLLEKDVGDIRRDGRASNSIISTWQISFEHIREVRASAARLLSLMSFFDRQGIPEILLQSYYKDSDDDVNFEDDLHTLISYSLLAINVEGNEFEMHRLVQFSTKKWLELYNELEKWKEKYIAIIGKAFPTGDFEDWDLCQRLFPHAEVVLAYKPKNHDYIAQWTNVLTNAAWYARGKGSYIIAEKMNQEALDGREKALGKEHPHTLTSVNDLALALQDQGKYEAAEQMYRRALDGYEKALGKEHPHTLTSVSNLALALQDQGKYEAAELMNRRALDGYEKALGKEHPHTLASVNDLALALRYQGKYEAVEQMYRRALDGYEKALGKEHPHTLTSVNNLASALRYQGKYEAAERMNRRALDGYEKALGKEHPHTLTSVSNLASALRYQGKYEVAERMNRRALDGYEKALGKEHPHTLRSVNSLALALQDQGKYEAAERMNRRALDGREKALGKEHPHTLTSVNDLALALRNQGKYEAAERMNRRALDGYEKALGKEHPHTLASVWCLARLLQDQRQYHDSTILYQRAYVGFQKTLSLDHPWTLSCLKHYTSMLEDMKGQNQEQ